MVLNNRKLFVLSLISKAYLKTGEPIGSKQIALELGGEVSSATIRNDMAQLEQEGLLFQPHTSAGRIPTAAGMRLYIDKLMEKRTISKQLRDKIDSLFKGFHGVEDTISAASSVLADYSQCASFSTSPSGSCLRLKQIDFIKVDARTMVFVILTQTNTVKSVFVRLDSTLTDSALNALSAFAQNRLTGMLFCDITPAFIQSMAAELSAYALLFSPFFEALSEVSRALSSPGVFVKGQDNLLRNAKSYSDAYAALNILHSDNILSLVAPQNNGVNIILPEAYGIGNTTVIYSGYKFSNDQIGTIGILGPYRLDYGSIIPMIEYFSSSLEKVLEQNELYK